ncbi:chitin synthase [Xylogone sp. PMI_703]|nr:chitin synthase [Xylogone sp. PMI_703]
MDLPTSYPDPKIPPSIFLHDTNEDTYELLTDIDEGYVNIDIPLNAKHHGPQLSNRGAGAAWNHYSTDLPKPPKTALLFNGNLVTDNSVPSRLLRQVPHSQNDEFTHMRYSAVTCGPEEFVEDRFTLRQPLFAPPRSTEIMIVVTMYNEDDILLARTLRGIFANIKYLTTCQEQPWGRSAWKKVVVCIISDGRAKIHPRTRSLLTLLGVYQDGVAKSQVNHRDVVAHLYEYTTQFSVAIKGGTVRVSPTGAVPCQLLFCLKERNQKKINSHRWALQAFGSILNPKICVFVDAATEPESKSIYHTWKAFHDHPNCGSISGETKVLLVNRQNRLTNPLIAAQDFQYKLWNVLDRPFDSLFGLRFDMPGAMLAYRFPAILNDEKGEGPLKEYFKAEGIPYGNNIDIFAANMALTEERALSFAMLTKKHCNWNLRYEYLASVKTDVPDLALHYILQQRRWYNGTLFGSVYAITHIHRIFQSSHSNARKLLLLVQCGYQGMAILFSWISIGNFFLVFHILTKVFIESSMTQISASAVEQFLNFSYSATLLLSFVYCLGHGSRDTGFLSILVTSWSIFMIILALVMIGLVVICIRDGLFGISSSILTNSITLNLLFPLCLTYTFWLILAIISGSPGHMFNSIIQYIILLPMRINVSNLYALCQIHDISWGTRGDNLPQALPSVRVDASKYSFDDMNASDSGYETAMQQLRTKELKAEISSWDGDAIVRKLQRSRTIVMVSWALTNGILVAAVVNSTRSPDSDRRPEDFHRSIRYVGWILWPFTILTGTKFCGAIYYFIKQSASRSRSLGETEKRKVT